MGAQTVVFYTMENQTIEIDGSLGEGGGQVLRTSLALSAVTGRAFRIVNIRANRDRPGLRNQHRTAVMAAAQVCGASVEGVEVDSRTLEFSPGAIAGGTYTFDVGTAGSTTLVAQTVLPILLFADISSVMTIVGGTHNGMAPPFEFLDRVFVPALREMGAGVEVALNSYGFYPKGGGTIELVVEPMKTWRRFERLARGAAVSRQGVAVISKLHRHIAERELQVLRSQLKLAPEKTHLEWVLGSPGPGNAVFVDLNYEHARELVSEVGKRGVSAEEVAQRVCNEVERFEGSGAPVGEHLADQLLLPMALGAGGTFRTLKPTRHTRTNIEVIRLFLEVDIDVTPQDDGIWLVTVGT